MAYLFIMLSSSITFPKRVSQVLSIYRMIKDSSTIKPRCYLKMHSAMHGEVACIVTWVDTRRDVLWHGMFRRLICMMNGNVPPGKGTFSGRRHAKGVEICKFYCRKEVASWNAAWSSGQRIGFTTAVVTFDPPRATSWECICPDFDWVNLILHHACK